MSVQAADALMAVFGFERATLRGDGESGTTAVHGLGGCMSDKMREEFEEAHKTELNRLVANYGVQPSLHVAYTRDNSGLYHSGIVQAAWWGWQASRAALVVELPAEIDQFADDDPGRRAFSLHTNSAIRSCAKAIHAAGVKTK